MGAAVSQSPSDRRCCGLGGSGTRGDMARMRARRTNSVGESDADTLSRGEDAAFEPGGDEDEDVKEAYAQLPELQKAKSVDLNAFRKTLPSKANPDKPRRSKSKEPKSPYADYAVARDVIVDYKLRYLKDKKKGLIGPIVSDLLGIKYHADESTGDICRVGVHREGTCFFHSLLDSINATASDEKLDTSSEIAGLNTDDKRAYRNLGHKARKAFGASWRAYLAKQVTPAWFAKNLNTNTTDDALGIWDSARGRMITYVEYVKDYANPDMYVGDTVWKHISKTLKVNMFIIVVSGDQPRVYEANDYDPSIKSVILYLHDKGGSRGHYESVQQSDGRGLFHHTSSMVQRLIKACTDQQG